MTKARLSRYMTPKLKQKFVFPTKKDVANGRENLAGSLLTKWYVRLFERANNLKESDRGS